MLRRRILANLDCESEFARLAASRRREQGGVAPRADDPRFALPHRVVPVIAAAGTLLRVLADDGDILWTPAPVESSRLPAVEGLPLPPLENGGLRSVSASRSYLAWGETEGVAWLRRRDGEVGEAAPRRSRPRSLRERLWAVPPPPADSTAEVNHRGFGQLAAIAAGCELPGATVVVSLADLGRRLAATLRAAKTPTPALREAWVLKTPHSAAGRDRIFGRGEALSPGQEARAARLLELHGALVLEPWLERTADFGACGVVGGGGLHVAGTHALEVDSRGGFRGIALRAGDARAPGLGDGEHERALEALEVAARRASVAGYRGPIAVDSWRYRDASGEERFHPLGEVNARMSFGLVARLIAERLLAAGTVAPGDTLALRLGPAGADSTAGATQDSRLDSPSRRLVLLEPAADDATCAWLEVWTTLSREC